jgi:hypothetical protein
LQEKYYFRFEKNCTYFLERITIIVSSNYFGYAEDTDKRWDDFLGLIFDERPCLIAAVAGGGVGLSSAGRWAPIGSIGALILSD